MTITHKQVRWFGKTPTRLPEATLLMLPLASCSEAAGGVSTATGNRPLLVISGLSV